ncbi:hypothetical protein [Streptomyces acidiscabies]|uniref:Uncharacterized protein n=1 Tax=Streptomyces acidiscabies TaxID=42234 RepID=A0AAP6BAU0_9ACTN|nr:hypothetical protein [Streptomyces acidiscabies]MBZ3917095.1 hypothetical protein [Streptomyces acidiscabies]MDX2961335.1 hypothetical protein [Streptomyces acidiscabies]MDX3022693.1 hypothetical protein [Streptomyces acidiscabies]MDX3792057.1 hypothetical protein [Streptomyces acidiscabies]GAQ50910.1 hypothetical protein a10_00689 [Streptomyces acidiscabies]
MPTSPAVEVPPLLPAPPPPNPELRPAHEMFLAVMAAPYLHRPAPTSGRRR